MKKVVFTVFLISMLSGFSLIGGSQRVEAEIALKAATHLELVRGDLQAAIKQYEKVIRSFPDQRPIVAEALVKLGLSYEKLGREEAKSTFERVVSEYSDQLQQAELARGRLAVLNDQEVSPGDGPVIRQVWADDPDVDFTGSVSPDGRLLAFTEWGDGNIAIRDLDADESRPLTHSEEYLTGFGMGSAFSPDSRKIVYRWLSDQQTELRILPVDASQGTVDPKILLSVEEQGGLGIGSWTPDGKSVLVAIGRGDGSLTLSFVSLADGAITMLKSLGGWSAMPELSLSPDGRYIGYDFSPDEQSSARDIFLLAMDASRDVTLIEHEADDQLVGWSPDGDSVLFLSDRGGSQGLWAIDVEEGRAAGSAQLIQPGIGEITPIGITRKGSFYYGSNKGLSDIFITHIEDGRLTDELQKLPSRTEGSNAQVAWSPDGTRLAYISTSQKGRLVIQNVSTGSESEVETDGLELIHYARIFWSPDGSEIAAAGRRPNGQYRVFRIEIATGEVTILVEPPPDNAGVYPIGWSPDGRQFYFRLNHRIGEAENYHRSVMAKNLASGEIRRMVSFEGNSIGEGALSPDGRYFAVVEVRGDEQELLTVSLPEGSRKSLYRFGDGDRYGVAWSRDSNFVYFRRGSEYGPKELWRIPMEGGEPEPTGIRFEFIRTPVFHPNGQTLAFWGNENKEEIWVMERFLSASR